MAVIDATEMKEWKRLAKELVEISNDLCADCELPNHCDECANFAYVAEDAHLSDVCYPDYHQGWGSYDVEAHGHLAAIPLPWEGSGEELKEEVAEQTYVCYVEDSTPVLN